MVPLPIIDNQIRPDVCGPCGGRCCQSFPGYFHPRELGNCRSELSKALFDRLKSGKYLLDIMDKSPIVALGLRPLRHGEIGIVRKTAGYPVLDKFCKLWQENGGCTLAAADRPAQCRALVPKLNAECGVDDPRFGNILLSIAWKLVEPAVIDVLTEMTDEPQYWKQWAHLNQPDLREVLKELEIVDA